MSGWLIGAVIVFLIAVVVIGVVSWLLNEILNWMGW